MLELWDGLYANVPHHAAEMLQQRMPGAVQQREAVLHGHAGQRMPGMRDADPAERRSRALASMRKRGSLCSHEEKYSSAHASAGQRDRISQSAGADHAQQICACAPALQAGAGAAQARSFPGRPCPTGSLLPGSAGSCRYITRCTRNFLQIRSCMQMRRRSWCCGSRSGRRWQTSIFFVS